MIFTVFIFLIILIVKIKYGDYAITHITTRPYNFIMALLIVMMFEILAWIINSTYYPIHYSMDLKDREITPLTQFNQILFTFTMVAKLLLTAMFLFSRTFEHNLMNYFMYY